MEVSFAGLVTDEFSLKSVIIFRSLFLPQHLLLTGLITLAKQHAGPVIIYCRFIGRQPTARFKIITFGKFNITSSVTSRRNSAVQMWIEVTCGLSSSVYFLGTGKEEAFSTVVVFISDCGNTAKWSNRMCPTANY
jgi:hypothetical protein